VQVIYKREIMEKFTILFVAMLLTSGIAFAQNSATSTTTGNDNEAIIDQLFQSGASSDINQATTVQMGNDNKILAPNQVGAGNVLVIEQIGSENIIDRGEQGFNGWPSFDGSIIIMQNGDGNGIWDSDQAGSNNALTINQDGDDFANVDAQISSEGGSGNKITIDQLGGSNFVGEYSHNGAGAYQEGDGNEMDIDQAGGAQAGVTDYLVSGATEKFFRGSIENGQGLIQFGNNNMLTISQNGASTVTFMVQEGSSNIATVNQTDDLNTASTLQIGDFNAAGITQN